ncbi:RNA-directed DNA polymerase, eukaryota, reverse transcriptase zinc-binding domain protein [Tanacetum coccineum]
MTNKKKPNNRSNKRNIKLPIRYNDHVMSNVSQNKTNSDHNKKIDEIRINIEGNDENNDVMENKLDDEMNKTGDLNARYDDYSGIEINKPTDNDSVSLSSDKKGLDSDKECLDADVQEIKQDEISLESSGKSMKNDNKENESENSSLVKTYAHVTMNSKASMDNNLRSIPTVLNDLGEEVVVFDEEMVKLGSKKWELTLCGQCCTSGDPEIGLDRIEPKVLPVWVELVNMPMEAWTNEGISAIASCIGKPKIMDSMTSYVCKNGLGRTEFARVFVEIEAVKGFKNEVEIQYRDKDQGIKGTKKVKVEYDWKDLLCSHCKKHNGSKIMPDKEKGQNQSNKERSLDEEFPRLTKQNNHNSKNKEVGGSSNKYTLALRKMKNWSKEMREYYKISWDSDREKEKNEMMDRMKGIVEDVVEDSSFAVKNVTANVINKRIFIGWNPDVVRMMAIHESKQQMLCLIKNIKDHSKVFCSFIYASNSIFERRELWKESTIDGDRQEFIECVNSLEIEDVCSSGLHFTWIKSPSSPTTSVMKKLDRIMANEEFIRTYSKAFAIFHPFLVSDHSPVVLVIPNAMSKKKRSFKFANFVAEKEDFLPMVEQSWNEKVNGCIILREKLKDAQNAVNDQPYDNERKRIVAAVLNDYNEAMADEDKLLFQMAKVEWLNEGDRITTYFHKVVKSKRNKNRIMSINNIQGVVVEGNDIVTEFVKHFEKFLGQSQHVEPLAIKDFFKNGKLLKEINSTLIALIPKVAQPNNVTEFRPIACCNGRSIQDKILMTRELLKGYNRKWGLKICSLKNDIAKAYDTVSWEFLRNILRMFRFHDRMIEWICTCITSTSLSININGESHGNFKKGRGLRQSDPISSYLFTLMEVFTLIMNSKIQQAKNFKYHAGCKEMKLTHLCFADDLLVLCHGSEESVIAIKEALDLFSKVSCLKPNMNKSTIYFSNVDIGEKCRILNIMPFQVGSFPTRYLGVPLISKRLGKTKRKQLVDKVKSKVGDWKNKFLSYAGRDIERILKGFLWNQGDVVRGKAAWKTIYKPKIKVKLKGRGVWEIDVEANDSWTWKNLLNLKSKARRHIKHTIGNGENTLIWFDKWCESGPLCQIITNIDIYDGRFNLKASVADMITNGEWIWND